MTLPLIILAGLSVVGGFVNTPFRASLEQFLEPSFEGVSVTHPPEGWLTFALLAALSVGAGLAGVLAAYLTYHRPAELWERFQASLGRVWQWWERGYGVDDLYGELIVIPGKRLAEEAAFRFDVGIIDRAVNGAGRVVQIIATRARALQSGWVRSYGLIFGAGAIAVIGWMLWRGA